MVFAELVKQSLFSLIDEMASVPWLFAKYPIADFSRYPLDTRNDMCYNNITNHYICGGENMANIQIRIDDATKTAADLLFNSLGLDTSTAVRMFISSALDHNGLPFEVRKSKPVRSSDEGKFSREYVAKLQEMWKDPDPTFMEQPEPHFTDRGELFE